MKKPKPPVFVIAAFAAMLAAHRWIPIRQILSFPWNLLGTLLLLSGMSLSLVALRLFRYRRTTPEPFGHPRALVTSGPFRFSRNPMYAGILLMCSGVAALLGSVTPWLAVLALAAVLDVYFVRPEEKQLELKFGAAYRRYRSCVRRWL